MCFLRPAFCFSVSMLSVIWVYFVIYVCHNYLVINVERHVMGLWYIYFLVSWMWRPLLKTVVCLVGYAWCVWNDLLCVDVEWCISCTRSCVFHLHLALSSCVFCLLFVCSCYLFKRHQRNAVCCLLFFLDPWGIAIVLYYIGPEGRPVLFEAVQCRCAIIFCWCFV